MKLATLITNTDESDFAQGHPKDGEKFSRLIRSVRADWSVADFPVKDGVFPDDPAAFDGLMITGSPASVHDGEGWISDLCDLIRKSVAAGVPIFGACFGHQAIALALGGVVGPNPGGWVFGLTEADVVPGPEWTKTLGPRLRQYAAHVEQVTTLPKDARVVLRSGACPIGGFAIGRSVYTTQNHPEMTHGFITALVEEYAAKIDPAVIKDARASLVQVADTTAYAETIAQFFEQAQ